MRCPPRAIDFDAFRGDILLPWNDPDGLRARWVVAHDCPQTINMIRLSAADLDALDNAARRATLQTGITVRLREIPSDPRK